LVDEGIDGLDGEGSEGLG
jgi:hypothetical protein